MHKAPEVKIEDEQQLSDPPALARVVIRSITPFFNFLSLSQERFTD